MDVQKSIQGCVIHSSYSADFSASGSFTAPLPGSYHFSWSAVSAANSFCRLALLKNGEETVASFGEKKQFQVSNDNFNKIQLS